MAESIKEWFTMAMIHAVSKIVQQELLEEQKFFRLVDARVVWADLAAIERDLVLDPYEGKGSVEEAIARRFLEFALISDAQFSSEEANEPIARSHEQVTGYRPARYGRAALFPSKTISYKDNPSDVSVFDVKGVGVAPGFVPNIKLHQTGLLSLIEALREIVMQAIIERIFKHLGYDIHGIPVYALLDLKFKGKYSGAGRYPAAIMVRKHNARLKGNPNLYPSDSDVYEMRLFIEECLRKYSITSSNNQNRMRIFRDDKSNELKIHFASERNFQPKQSDLKNLIEYYGIKIPFECDIVNVQIEKDFSIYKKTARIIDFGQYQLSDEDFKVPYTTIVTDRYMGIGEIIGPDHKRWQQVVPRLCLDRALLGSTNVPDGFYDWLGINQHSSPTGLTAFCAELARTSLSDDMTWIDTRNRINAFVAQATSHLDLS
jgi:hypothetical protein